MKKVLIVDDSRVFRGIVEETLKGVEDISVVASLWSGEKALLFLKDNDVDIITLDIEMPGIDGLETLRRIKKLYRGKEMPCIIMLSSLTEKGATATITALDIGAFDFVLKPDVSVISPASYLRKELLTKIKAWDKNIKPHSGPLRKKIATTHSPQVDSKSSIKAIVIGVSTGGPKALHKMLPELCKATSCPILIVQHMPEGFTESLAKNLNKSCSHLVKEAKDSELIKTNTIYIAPGGQHLLIKQNGSQSFTALNTQPPENGCRPSVDVLFRSAATSYKSGVIAIILTGMGADGTASLRPLKRVNAPVFVQDEKTSVVWGMPGSAVETGLVDEIIPLMRIPEKVMQMIERRNENG